MFIQYKALETLKVDIIVSPIAEHLILGRRRMLSGQYCIDLCQLIHVLNHDLGNRYIISPIAFQNLKGIAY